LEDLSIEPGNLSKTYFRPEKRTERYAFGLLFERGGNVLLNRNWGTDIFVL
jgi:hypothetical protein